MKAKDNRPALVIPPDLKAALALDKGAKAVFDALAYTHRKEHIQALFEAKQVETRARRLAKTMAMLRSDRPSRSNTVSTRSTVEKMRVKSGERILVLDAEPEAMTIFKKLPKGSSLETKAGKGGFDVVVLYVETAGKLAKRLPAAIKAGASGATLWIAYPKQSSGRTTTLNRDVGWEPTERHGLTHVTMIAFDAVWSGVKYRLA